MASGSAHFPFLDLPSEIRNQIYRENLCKFWYAGPIWRNTDVLERLLAQQPQCNGVNELVHEIQPALLRVCKQVYREAYDVMVKTNRFVRLDLRLSFFSSLLSEKQIPIVSMDRARTKQFEGYVMTATIVSKIDPAHLAYFSLMILAEDWPYFCEVLPAAIQNENIEVDMTFHPNVNRPTVELDVPSADPFTANLATGLLQPLEQHIRNLSRIDITVPAGLAPSLGPRISNIKQITTKPWNPDETLTRMQKMREEATGLFNGGNTIAAAALFHKIIEYGQTHLPIICLYPTQSDAILLLSHEAQLKMARCFNAHLIPTTISKLHKDIVATLAETTIQYTHNLPHGLADLNTPATKLMICRAYRVLAAAKDILSPDTVQNVGLMLVLDAEGAEGWDEEAQLWEQWKQRVEAGEWARR